MGSGHSPTPPSERLVGLDVLRGFALLGILVINIWLFSMPVAVLQNPTVYGDLTGANYLVWLVGHVFAQQKFITLFSLLFGAGIVLFTRSKDDSEADRLYFRRTGFLLAIGLAHAYLLWYGDILVQYALCGLIAASLRDWNPRMLTTFGFVFIGVTALTYLVQGLAADPGTQIGAWLPSDAALAREIETYRSGWLAQFDHRISTALRVQFSNTIWRTAGLMLWGMALFKSGVLSNDRSERFYRRLLLGGGVGGLALILFGVRYSFTTGWASAAAVGFGTQFNYWGSLLLAGAYIAAVMLYCRRRTEGPEITALSAVGRTALSNYLLQTVLATSIFYGHGLGLFGSVSRVEQAAVVVGIWTVQIVLSVLWLRYFRFGPVEWAWRTVTYESRQPLRRRNA